MLNVEQRIDRLEKIIVFLWKMLPSGWRLMVPKEAATLINYIEAEQKKEKD